MGIYLPNMEMPKENDYTIAIVYGDGVVTEYHEDYWIRGADGEKQLGTAVSVTPHGDLIDRGYAIATACSGRIRTLPITEDGENWIRVEEVRESIKNAPTVIEAEEGKTCADISR